MTENPAGQLKPRYSELKGEFFGKKQFDVVLVFGHSPIKPLLLPEELTPQQREEWQHFKAHPLQGNERGWEPEFRVLDEKFVTDLRNIQKRTDLDDATKTEMCNARRIEHQHNGRLVLNRISRVDALAAGLALYLGVTDKLILSGKGTIPKKVAGDPVNLPQSVYDQTPSEAAMMRDVIVSRFGRLMFKRDVSERDLHQKYSPEDPGSVDTNSEIYKKFVDEQYASYKENVLLPKMIVEEDSTNTFENYSGILQLDPTIKTAAFIGPLHHMGRLKAIPQLYSVNIEPFGALLDTDLLKARAKLNHKDAYLGILDYMTDPMINPELSQRIRDDNKWLQALIEPARMGYWIGYVMDLETDRLQTIFDMLNTPFYKEQAKNAFGAVNLDFEEFVLKPLDQVDPEKLANMRSSLKEGYKRGGALREASVANL